MPKQFYIDIEPEALEDIQKAIDYYDSTRVGLGEQFYNATDKHIELLRTNYNSFAIKYDDVRCLPLKKYPYTIHYRVLSAQKTVSIKAVFCDFEDPDKWEGRIE